MSLLPDAGPGVAFAQASRFREDLFDCLTMRGDELFELVDALLCADGPVTSPVELTLVAEHRRGHGAMYDAMNSGNLDVPRLSATGLEGLFDVVVTREDVARGKPAPDLFTEAARRLGVRPARCLVVEDADEGLAAARAAGMDAVDVRPFAVSAW
ncbi:HAD-IA family hydrolase [Streptomyces syringium]|uniref:HAD-IA family hydrolase n=1 Tax=Streptomyces syringium TaxID=76729 RepID=UPI00342C9577